jgi:adenylylsulfate kinase-like enzyme
MSAQRTKPAGVCIWFTGPSGGGKSTITHALVPRLEGLGLTVSVLDVVPLLRKRWWEKTSEGKLLRKAYVASEIVHHGGVVISVTVGARASVRAQAREMIGAERFVEVRVSPPPEVARQRKASRQRRPRLAKRLRRAARGFKAVFLGTKDEEIVGRPPDLEIDSSTVSPDEAADSILTLLNRRGLLPLPDDDG